MQTSSAVSGIISESGKCDICEICLKRFSLKEFMRYHQLTLAEGIEASVCDTCMSKFSMEQKLKTHCVSLGEPEEKYYACKICKTRYSLMENLKIHLFTHRKRKEEKSYTCEVCELKFSYKENLQSHRHRHLEKGTEIPYIYYAAKEAYPLKKNSSSSKIEFKNFYHSNVEKKQQSLPKVIKKHCLVLKPMNTYICGNCGEDFFSRREMHDHYSVHTQAEPIDAESRKSDLAMSVRPSKESIKIEKQFEIYL